MKTYFNIRYELDKAKVHEHIAERLTQPGSDYICVADGVVWNIANRKPEYLEVVNGGMFAICDSSWVPIYLRWIYGKKYEQYCGEEIFMDIVSSCKYRMIFLGSSEPVLRGLRENLSAVNPDVANMKFVELPFRKVENFDYESIAHMVEADGADIIWVALGAPKQEEFMYRLKAHLHHGVMISVGAVFKFRSGMEESRAPQWMVNRHLEFVHRLWKEPRKQSVRVWHILKMLPILLWREWKRRKRGGDIDS